MSKQMFVLRQDNIAELNRLLKDGWLILEIKKTDGGTDERGELVLWKY